MPTASAMDRTALAREARRIAEEVEGLYIQLEQVTHQQGVPPFDMLQAAKALRCYAGVLSLVASATVTHGSVDPKRTQLAGYTCTFLYFWSTMGKV